MKYTITINQYAAVKNNMDLDLIDLAIFDFIKDFVNSANCVKINTPEGVFFWVSHKLIMDSMPLLGIKSNNGIKRRVDNLISAGLLKKHPDCEKYRQTLYTFGENFDKLLFSDEASEPATKFTNPQQKLGVTRNENCGGTRNENCGYYNNNINNNIINNNIINNSYIPETFGKSLDYSNPINFQSEAFGICIKNYELKYKIRKLNLNDEKNLNKKEVINNNLSEINETPKFSGKKRLRAKNDNSTGAKTCPTTNSNSSNKLRKAIPVVNKSIKKKRLQLS
jgi:hypothetical protein